MALPKVVITLTLMDDGSLNVQGPLSDRLLMYGILMSAMDAVRLAERQKENKIFAPPPGMAQGMKRN